MTNPRAELKPSDRAIAQAVQERIDAGYWTGATEAIMERARALDAAQPAGVAVDSELLLLAADFETCIPFLPEPGQRNIAKAVARLRVIASQVVAGSVPDGWERMTQAAREIQSRHLDVHEGSVYHAMQSLVAKFGKPRTGPMIQDTPPASTNSAPTGSKSVGEGEARDAARYRWLRDCVNNSLSLTRNEGHAPNYMTASAWIDERDPDWFADVPADEIQKMRDTNTIWSLQVYPRTPICFDVWHAATLDAVIDAAMAEAKGAEG